MKCENIDGQCGAAWCDCDYQKRKRAKGLSMSAGSAVWDGSTDEIDSEVWCLVDLVENGWAWQWPGWSWIAESLNHWHKNNRTANACRKKYDRIISQNIK